MIDIAKYKADLRDTDPDRRFRDAVTADLTGRRDRHCPTELQPPPALNDG
jgi:hypothetical protein